MEDRYCSCCGHVLSPDDEDLCGACFDDFGSTQDCMTCPDHMQSDYGGCVYDNGKGVQCHLGYFPE